MHPRRKFLSTTLLGAGLALSRQTWSQSLLKKFNTDPFTLGVASGYPTANSVVLWTRLAISPLEPDGGMGHESIEVLWEIAYDEKFMRIAQSGTALAVLEWSHSVHAEPKNLQAGYDYFYRFTAGGLRSPIGRTWTATAPGMAATSLRIAVASCQNFENGFFNSYRHMQAASTNLIVHVGDYIYENAPVNYKPRAHLGGECLTLADYRLRHSLYRSDEDLRNAHAACPWLLTIDDHEVANDYANDSAGGPIGDSAKFLQRRAAAYRAYYENLPLPRAAIPDGTHMLFYTSRATSNLASFHLLDGRQYRSIQACVPAGRQGGARVYEEDCPEMADLSRTMLGKTQESFLDTQLLNSKTQWNFIAQATTVTRTDEDPGPRHRYWTDAWAGYPAARNRLINSIVQSKTNNPVILSGDIHAFVIADIHRSPDDPDSPIALSELVATSISASPPPEFVIDAYKTKIPDVWYASSKAHGYLQIDLSRDELKANLIAMDNVLNREATARVAGQYSIKAGKAGIKDISLSK